MVRLNPYAKHAKKQAAYVETIRKRSKEETLNKKRGVSFNLLSIVIDVIKSMLTLRPTCWDSVVYVANRSW